MKKQYLLVLLFFAGSIYTVVAQVSNLQPAVPETVKVSTERLLRIDRLIKQYVDSGWIVGATGFIARNGKIVYDKSFGVSDIETKAALRTDAIYRIASQTKAITSTAVLILLEEGKLLLDDPISKYIPSFANPTVLDKFNEKDSSYTAVPAKREVTIRDLLTHTSGVDYAGIGSPNMKAIYAKANIPSGIGTENYLLANTIPALGKLPLAHQPGERFTYGLNTDILGYLVQGVSGQSFDEFLKQRIFDPLGMKDTYFYLPSAKFSRLIAVHVEDENHKVIKWDSKKRGVNVDYPLAKGSYFSGGAGLVSTTKDYAIFLQALLNGGLYNNHRILSKRTVEIMTSNQIGDLSLGDDKFGLGFQITSEKGQARLGVSAGSFAWGGYFSTQYWADPKEKMVGLLFLQQTLSHGDIFDKFKVLVYQALND